MPSILSKLQVQQQVQTQQEGQMFSETFGQDWSKTWVESTWKGKDMGKFELQKGKYGKDEGLKTTEDQRFYGLSQEMDTFSNTDKDLIVQYSMKEEKSQECGGGYLKLGPKMEDPTTFGDPTSYNIMFGPDKCGSSSRTHLIFNYNGKNVLKKSDLPYKQDKEGVSTLYQLVLKKDNTQEVKINGDSVFSGSLEENWDLLPQKMIKDPEDKKPEDWVDTKMIQDPEDKKPEDWVEEEKIKDPKQTQPEDWDEEEDGEWEQPMIANPDYKGAWSAKMIENPEYKGEWVQKEIENPEYKADDKLYAFKEFGFVGMDLWQVKSGSIFDDILITDSMDEQKEWEQKWKTKHDEEVQLKKEQDDKAQEEQKQKQEQEAQSKKDEEPEVDDDDDDDDDEVEDKKDEEKEL